jgi:hypothetical protein
VPWRSNARHSTLINAASNIADSHNLSRYKLGPVLN